MRWPARSIGMAVVLGAMAVAVLAIPAAAQEVDAPTVTGASPLSGPAGGGTVVTMTGSGFLPGVTEVMVVGTGYSFQSEIPASAMTINAERTTMSFAMPASPPAGGLAGLIAFVPGKQSAFRPTYTYQPLAVTGASPSSGLVTGGMVVTMTGTGFQPGVTQVMMVLQGGGWQREIPASAMTINAEGTTMSFAMPEGPPGGGLVGMVAFVPGIQAGFVPTFTYAQLAVTDASPLSGPVAGGTVVTMTGTGFQPGVTQVMVVFTGGLWQQGIPASAMTINAEQTTMSFAMPDSPAGPGEAGLVAFVPGIQARFVPTFTYGTATATATAPRQRVADDQATLPATGSDAGVLLATATGAVMIGVGLLAVARRRRAC